MLPVCGLVRADPRDRPAVLQVPGDPQGDREGHQEALVLQAGRAAGSVLADRADLRGDRPDRWALPGGPRDRGGAAVVQAAVPQVVLPADRREALPVG